MSPFTGPLSDSATSDIHYRARIQELIVERDAAAREAKRMREALEKIVNHWANSYDHPYCDTEQYRGPYGIGVVDGHRACTLIARAALHPEAPHDSE